MVRRVDDYEFPSGVDLEYRIEGLTGAAAGATVVQVATVTRRSIADSVWFKFITSPALNRRLEFMGRTDISRDSRSAVYRCRAGRTRWWCRMCTRRAVHDQGEDRDTRRHRALDHALSQGLPCYLQVPATINTPSIYATIGSYSFEAPATQVAAERVDDPADRGRPAAGVAGVAAGHLAADDRPVPDVGGP
jgi:hypothetical protein